MLRLVVILAEIQFISKGVADYSLQLMEGIDSALWLVNADERL